MKPFLRAFLFRYVPSWRASLLRALAVSTACLALPVAGAASGPVTVAQFTQAQPNVRFMTVYKLRYLSAKSVAVVLRHSFAGITVEVVSDANALAVTANAAEQKRISDALAQLDLPHGGAADAAAPSTPAPAIAVATSSDANATGVDVVTLHAAIPGVNGAPSSSAGDIANAVMQALGPQLPDLRITVYGSQSQLLLTGSPAAIRVARELIDKLDALPKMVVLDVTIVEVDESVSKNLGLSLNPTVISTTYTETTPAAPSSGGTAPPLLGLQQFSRTPLSIGFQLNLLIQNGNAKVVADPKLTTLSGRTASIRAGDNIAILTTTGGSVGTVATTQLVTFNTGVQLDITPIINADNFISVTLHPTVNNLASIANGVPQISTRDAQTTVALREGQTLVIGGLIEDSLNKTVQKVPVLGYLPVLGPLFTQTQTTGSRNELIITVTPHIVDPLSAPPQTGPSMTDLPTPQPLGTPMSYISVPASGVPPVPSTLVTPVPTPTPAAPASSFVYGQRPASVPPAGPNDQPRIFYISASPNVVRNGTSITIDAVTSPNVTRVTIQLGAASVNLHPAGPGLWDATVPFSMATTSQMTPATTAVLSAVRPDGVATTMNIPLTVLP